MNAEPHRVHRYLVELHCTSREVAEQAQRICLERCGPELQAVVERVFSERMAPEETGVIDSLEVDLGAVPLGRLEDHLPQQLETALRDALAATPRVKKNATTSNDAPESGGLSLPLAQVLHYLRRGTLPWWAPDAPPDALESSLDALLTDQASTFTSWLKAQGLAPQVGIRLIEQFGTHRAAASLALVAPSLRQALAKALRSVEGSADSEAEAKALLEGVWQEVARHPAGESVGAAAVAEVQRRLASGGSVASQPSAGTNAPRRVAPAGPRGRRAALSQPTTQPPEPGAETVARPWMLPELAEDSVAVANAGLVLLWPYLGHLFVRTGLRVDEAWRDPDAPARAVHLLQYTVAGIEGAPEHALLLNKLLCGLHPDAPLPRAVGVNRIEKEECERMLEAVIQHWSVLRGASLRGFRQAFLQRDGLLGPDGHHWRLRVERRGPDVLLDRLPWGLTMIRLSWMTILIEVEW